MNPVLSFLFLALVPSVSGGLAYYFQFESISMIVNEGDGVVSVKIVRSGPTGEGGFFEVKASHVTTDDQDVILANQKVTFGKDDTEKIVNFTVIDDDEVEPDYEEFTLTLTKIGVPIPNIFIGEPSTITISIEDNEEPPTTDIQAGNGEGTAEVDEEAKLTIQCDEDYISVSFSLKDYPKADVSTAQLEGQDCKPETMNETVTFKFGLEACGTKKSKSEDGKYIVYENEIKMDMKYEMPGDQTISRSHSVVFPFTCSYDNKALVSGGITEDGDVVGQTVGKISFNPRSTEIITQAADYGNFTYYMDMYESDQYEEPIAEYPVEVAIGRSIYLQLKVESGDSQLVLFPDWCKATLSSDHGSEPKHLIMENTCSRDNTLDYTYVPGAVQQFSLAAFRFTESYDDVYLHCQVTVCRSADTESRCAKGCTEGGSKRKRREVTDEMAETLYVGPITLASSQSKVGAPAVTSSSGVSTMTLVAVIAGLLAFMALILIVGLAVLIHRRRAPSAGVLLIQDE